MEQKKFSSSKSLVETNAVKKTVEVFFRSDSIKKSINNSPTPNGVGTGGQTTSPYGGGGCQRSYVKPIVMRVDGNLISEIDFYFNLNNSTVEVINRHPTRDFWVISIDATTVKQFVDRDGISHDYHTSETMYVMNAKTISKLRELEKQSAPVVNGFEEEL